MEQAPMQSTSTPLTSASRCALRTRRATSWSGAIPTRTRVRATTAQPPAKCPSELLPIA